MARPGRSRCGSYVTLPHGSRARLSQPVLKRALFLTQEPPLPAVGGHRVRALNLLRELVRRDWRVSLFSVDAAATKASVDLAGLQSLCDSVVIVPIDRSGLGWRLRAASGVLRGRPFPEWFFHSPALAARFRDAVEMEQFDIVMVEGLYMHPYLDSESPTPVVLDCHNVETRRLETIAAAQGMRPRGLAARLQLRSVRRYERAAVQEAALCLVVSETEKRYLEQFGPRAVGMVPNGVDCDAYPARSAVPNGPELLFLGTLDYSANVDAVNYLTTSILPRVESQDVRVTLVGRGAGRRIRRHLRRSPVNIDLVGEVEDTKPYLDRARAFVVPLRFGGGTRLKILEAMASGLPVISTSAGAEGLGLRHGHDALIADKPVDFARWIDRLLEDDDFCRAIGEAGRATVEERFDWKRIGSALDAGLADLLKAPR
jgi:glycosyltransferase involved in cell wall biosynthesis